MTSQSRPLKFRAWDEQNRKMWMGVTVPGDGRFPEMQFTGKLDESGREIYEFDVVRVADRWNGTVVFSDFRWSIEGESFFLHLSTREPLKVVGNIYEPVNPV